MKSRLILTMAAGIGLVCASNASAALTYFDAQIYDIQTSAKSVTLANTVMCAPGNNCAETAFTALPLGPGTEGPPATTNPSGNWTRNGANAVPNNGQDGLWNQRFATPAPGNFGNPEPATFPNASGDGTVYEARGVFNGVNDEDPPVLKTTINVLAADVGTTRGVYALFWADGGPNWQLAACLECVEDENMPLYRAGDVGGAVGSGNSGTGYVFGVYDPAVGNPANLINYLEFASNGLTTSDNPGGRRLMAAWLGNVELGQTLTVFVGDGPLPVLVPPAVDTHNYRAWYDGIAYGDVQDLTPLPCVPEPASLVLVGLGVAGFVLRRRR